MTRDAGRPSKFGLGRRDVGEQAPAQPSKRLFGPRRLPRVSEAVMLAYEASCRDSERKKKGPADGAGNG